MNISDFTPAMDTFRVRGFLPRIVTCTLRPAYKYFRDSPRLYVVVVLALPLSVVLMSAAL